MSKWTDNMNPEQIEVIEHTYGPIGAFATAGSGKTRALVHRIARLVKEVRIPAERICAVTFSKKAADEMNERLDTLGIHAARVGTWHSLCLEILRTDCSPYAQWKIDDSNQHRIVLKEVLGYKHLDWKGSDLTKVCKFIGLCKANLWVASDPEAEALAKKLFHHEATKALQAYVMSEDFVHQRGILTFDDFLTHTYNHLLPEETRAEWANKYDFLLQDEAQDANRAQVEIADMLARDHRNYMVVGDPAQSIYAFRGSSPSYILDFEKKWDAKIVYMNRNYRCGSEIVKVANDAIRPAEVRLPVDMIAEVSHAGSVKRVESMTLDTEADDFVETIKRHQNDGGRLADITCLFRTNAQSRALEEGLLGAKIPYTILGATSFYERKEVKGLLAYLRVAVGRDTSGDEVKRCINAPFRFLGAAFVSKVMMVATRYDMSSCDWEAIAEEAATAAGIQARQRNSVREWADVMATIRQLMDSEKFYDAEDSNSPLGMGKDKSARIYERSPGYILQEVVRKTRYLEWLAKEEGEESIETSHASNVRELCRVADRFASVDELLNYIDRSIREAKNQRQRKTGDRVLLMSIHRSKGLEWPIVWVCGCNEEILPHGKSEDIDEERRLFYVAVTRAQKALYLSHVVTMSGKGGKLRMLPPSRFLVDAGLVDSDEDQPTMTREAFAPDA
jgi:DNA helicase-2/ATP-dependent DNA helicase PcrA